jgi:hypothetical protein
MNIVQASKNNKNSYIGKKRKSKKLHKIMELFLKIVSVLLGFMMITIQVEPAAIEPSSIYELIFIF